MLKARLYQAASNSESNWKKVIMCCYIHAKGRSVCLKKTRWLIPSLNSPATQIKNRNRCYNAAIWKYMLVEKHMLVQVYYFCSSFLKWFQKFMYIFLQWKKVFLATNAIGSHTSILLMSVLLKNHVSLNNPSGICICKGFLLRVCWSVSCLSLTHSYCC